MAAYSSSTAVCSTEENKLVPYFNNSSAIHQLPDKNGNKKKAKNNQPIE